MTFDDMSWDEIVEACRPMFTYPDPFESPVESLAALHADMWMDIGQRLTCSEADALVGVLRALGLRDHADSLMVSHVQGDRASEDDAHYIEGLSDHE